MRLAGLLLCVFPENSRTVLLNAKVSLSSDFVPLTVFPSAVSKFFVAFLL